VEEHKRRIFTPDEIYKKLIAALEHKEPLPPADWCASQIDEELWRATNDYEPDAFLRQEDALRTCLAYLVDFAVRMPEWINTTEKNERVKKMCGELADEIEKITVAPDEIIRKRGKLKSWLKAILSVQTCLIYREETERVIAEQDAAKRAARASLTKINKPVATAANKEKWQSDLAKSIFEKTSRQIPEKLSEKLLEQEQPSLF
jgi:hypothetical protein